MHTIRRLAIPAALIALAVGVTAVGVPTPGATAAGDASKNDPVAFVHGYSPPPPLGPTQPGGNVTDYPLGHNWETAEFRAGMGHVSTVESRPGEPRR
jgi:hypothetical protein